MSSSAAAAAAATGGTYFTSAGAAAALLQQQQQPPLVTVTPLPPSSGLTPQDLHDLEQIVNLEAVIASVPAASEAVPTLTEPMAAAPAATRWLQPFEDRVYQVRGRPGGIWLHGEPSSALEPGFRAIICLEARPASLPSYLGLPTDLDSYRYQVFLQRTAGPNEMFGRWTEDEAKDEGRAGVNNDDPCPLIGRRTLRLHLHEYLSLLTLVREEWQAIETRLPATARQLQNSDQPVPTDPGVSYVGEGGVAIFRARMKDRIFFQARLDSDHPVTSHIWGRLDVRKTNNNAALTGKNFHRMEIPFSALVAVAVRYHTLYADLLNQWNNSLRVGSGGGDDARRSRKREAPSADRTAAAPAATGDALETASGSARSVSTNARDKTSVRSSAPPAKSFPPQHHKHRSSGGKNIGNYQRHRKRSGSQSSTASSSYQRK
jgi:hypothetical protein